MAERESRPLSPEDLLRLKDEIVARWRQLPPEHQATMALVLFQQVLEGDYGPWLRGAARTLDPPDSESPFRFLPVIRISRSHLAQANLTAEEMAGLDEEDLLQISRALVRHYTHEVFWEELASLARETLAEKRSG
ncbi:MAG: hypothetical protein Kow00106_19480 [Anaerolineae bacterium]